MKNWQDKIGNPLQVGGIETAVLDNGPGRGSRIAWVNTGSPLRYKVALDRCMDIVDAFHAEHSLAWLSHAATASPDPAAIAGTEWLRSFNGGLLATCGLTHIGPPENDDFGTRGLHGRIGNLPCELTRVEQPDPWQGKKTMSLTGVVRQTSTFGPNLELRRTIRGHLGIPEIQIEDTVVNCGNSPAPHMLLYHCNFGYPLIDDGARLVWNGTTRSRGGAQDDAVFASDHDYTVCQSPLAEHAGPGEACAFVHPEPNDDGQCVAGIRNPRISLALSLTFDSAQLPCLANWQHWGPREYVTALEPGTHFPVGQGVARNEETLSLLEPGEAREYHLTIRCATNTDSLP